ERVEAERPQVLIIRDTRESGEMLEAAIAAGVTAAGGDAMLGGILPTPAAPLLVRRHRLDLAAVISASHNPYEDNGIKLFGPDGRNINDGCGSTHLALLKTAVSEGEHDAGFAFDGDGDRVLAVDRRGEVVDGDELIALAALHLRARSRLPGNGVVVTVMTNYGFHSAMQRAGIEVATTNVGDRYVLDELRARGWTLGGEQSGHI